VGSTPASYTRTMGTGSFPEVKRPGPGVDHPPPSRREIKERVDLYAYSPSGPSRPVLGRTLPLMKIIVGSWPRCALSSKARDVGFPFKSNYTYVYMSIFFCVGRDLATGHPPAARNPIKYLQTRFLQPEKRKPLAYWAVAQYKKGWEEEGIKTKYKAEETVMLERMKGTEHREKIMGIKKRVKWYF
jgi:hypothetical protein